MSIKAQSLAARSSALAVARPRTTVLVVTGRDRLTWLNGLVTCDLLKCSVNDAVYGLVVARSGRVIADVTVLVGESRLLVAVPDATVDALLAHLEHYLVMEDAEVDASGGGLKVWTIHGPRSAEVLVAARGAGGLGAVLDTTGLGGAILFVPSFGAPAVPGLSFGAPTPNAVAEAVREALESALARCGGVIGDEPGWQALRLERAVAEYGMDFDDKTYPQEASLEKIAVSFAKGCYLGQEVVCMLEMRGHVKRRLSSLIIGTEDAPPRGAAVLDSQGTSVGEITSAAISPTLNKAVALAMVKRNCAVAGTELVVAGAPATVVERPA